MCSTMPQLFVWLLVKHYFYKCKVKGEVVSLRLWVRVVKHYSLFFFNKKMSKMEGDGNLVWCWSRWQGKDEILER